MSYEEGLTNKISNADIIQQNLMMTTLVYMLVITQHIVTNDKYEEASKYLKVRKIYQMNYQSIFQSDHLVEDLEKYWKMMVLWVYYSCSDDDR